MTSAGYHRPVPTLDVRRAFLRRTDLSGTKLQRANLQGADFSGASFRGADFKDARLEGTILRGADLSGAQNLTIEQLALAIIDEKTVLPAYVDHQRLAQISKLPLKAAF